MAISFDATTSGNANNSSSVTFSHTCTGTNRILIVAAGATGTNGIEITGVTYNGVAMTKIGSNRNLQSNTTTNLWYIVAPATGANNIVISSNGNSSTFIRGVSMSYTGVDQVSPIDAHAGAIGSGTAISETVTTVASNCWVVATVYGNGTPTVTTNIVERGFQPSSVRRLIGGDSNAAVETPGNYTMELTQSSSDVFGIQISSIKPVSTASTFVATMQII